jgi:hypothetical protein
MSIEAPQLIWINLVVIGCIVNIVLHGHQKAPSKVEAHIFIIRQMLLGLLLYWGGFFG